MQITLSDEMLQTLIMAVNEAIVETEYHLQYLSARDRRQRYLKALEMLRELRGAKR